MKTCPNCQSHNIYAIRNGIGNDFKVKVHQDGDWMVATEDWETHLCTDCGYYENYLLNREWLDKIRMGAWRNWRKVG